MPIKRLLILLLSLIPFTKGFASELKDSLAVGLNTYSDSADVQVYSPTFELFKTLSKEFMLGVKMRVDAITAASISNGGQPAQADAVTGASSSDRLDEKRYAGTVMGVYEKEDDLFSGGVYYSDENDYTGRAVFGSYVRQLNQQNTALGVGFSQSDDKWYPVYDRDISRSDRKEQKIDLSINQLISAESSVQAVYSHLVSEGFLSSPYYYVIQDDLAKFERYPEDREGNAFALKGVVLLDEANSLNMGYRYYQDDWQISSHTINGEILHDVNDKLVLGLRLRWYTQSDAEFAKKVGTYTTDDVYFATDYRMSAFDSYTIGVPIIFETEGDYTITGSVDYYRTSENDYIKNWHGDEYLSAFFTTFSVEYAF